MKLAIACLAAAAMLPGAALAQTCSSPIPLNAGSSYSADTSTASDIVGQVGPSQSSGPDVVYSFVANGVSPSEAITITNPTYDWAMWLTTGCAASIGSGAVVSAASGTTGNGGSMALNGGGSPLTDGTLYYVIVTNSPADNSGQSGTLDFSTPTPLPVELQNFSAE